MTQPQHVHIAVSTVWADQEQPGLVLETQIRDGAWWALVVWAEAYTGGWTVKQRWVEAGKVRPVGGDG